VLEEYEGRKFEEYEDREFGEKEPRETKERQRAVSEGITVDRRTVDPSVVSCAKGER